MLKALFAGLVIFLVMGGWLLVQHLSRQFARRHPEYGPVRDEGGACGSGCLCGSGGNSCSKR